jgi:hypothetical protein
LIFDSQAEKQTISFTKTNPGEGWMNELKNTENQNGPISLEKNESIWSSKTFSLKNIPDGLSIRILAYGAVKVYLNGGLVLDKRIIGKRHYEDYNVSEFKNLLKTGENQISICAEGFETKGLFDYGLYSY